MWDKTKNWAANYWQSSLDKRSTKGLIVMCVAIAAFAGVMVWGLFLK